MRTTSRAGRKGNEIDTRKLRMNAMARKTMPGMQNARDMVWVAVEDDRLEVLGRDGGGWGKRGV